MGKKVNLPIFADDPKVTGESPSPSVPAKKPSIDAARARLGGRTLDIEPPPPAGFAPGVIVTFAASSKATKPSKRSIGVIVFASSVEVHVLLDGIRLRRMPPQELTLHEGDVEGDLGKIAADARLFGQLAEGQSVRYAEDAGGLIDGKVVEKCRWGALVLRDDGAVIAVGFRKLWPAPRSEIG